MYDYKIEVLMSGLCNLSSHNGILVLNRSFKDCSTALWRELATQGFPRINSTIVSSSILYYIQKGA
jgi:hypothetical protein